MRRSYREGEMERVQLWVEIRDLCFLVVRSSLGAQESA